MGLTIPLKLSLALVVWFALVEMAVEGWYRFHEPKWQGWNWTVEWPQQSAAFRVIEIPKRSLHLLMCDESHAATWKEPGGKKWAGYWLRWNPGNAAAEIAKVHRPDVCLNAEGAIMERDLGMQNISVSGVQIPFHCYTFRMNENILYVFFCLDEQTSDHSATASTPQFEGVDMIQRALKGRRRIGLQSLELALSGYQSDASAQQAFQSRLTELLHIRQAALPVAKE
jgi:hypothetical protein